MRNPLFESLVSKANSYKNPFLVEQDDKAQPGTVFADYVKSLAKMGDDLVTNLISAINSYPEGESKFKDQYKADMATKLQGLVDSVDDTKPIGIQIDSLFKATKQEAQNFLSASKADTEYVGLLGDWRKNLSSGFENYEKAIKRSLEYVKKQEDSGQAKMEEKEYKLLKSYIQTSLDSFKKAESDKVQTLESSSFGFYGYSDHKEIIEQLINNKIVVDFNSFNKIINEAKEDRVARRNARAAIAKVETLEGLVRGAMEQIAMRSGDPSKKDFKSLAMNGEFVSLAKGVADVKAELEVDDDQKKNIDFTQIEKTISNLESLFKSKKEEFDKSYEDESKTLRSFKTLGIATPEVEKLKSDGDNAFKALPMLSLNAANQAAIIRKQPKSTAGTAGTAGSAGTAGTAGAAGAAVKISGSVKYSSSKRGVVNDDVKKTQQLIIDKLGGKLKDDESYKRFAKYGADGKFGQNTRNIIVAVKTGLGLTDDSSDVTQELIDRLLKESVSFVKESVSSVKEDFNIDAYKKKIGSAPAVVKKSTPAPAPAPAPSPAPAGTPAPAPAPAPATVPAADVAAVAEEIQTILVKASDSIKELFRDDSFWQEFKGVIDDNEADGKTAFGDWWDLQINKKAIKKANDKIATLPDGDEKETMLKSVTALTNLKASIDKKIMGNTSDDTAYWKIYKLDGTTSSYSVDTDF